MILKCLKFILVMTAIAGLLESWHGFSADRAISLADREPASRENPCRQWGKRYIILQDVSTLEARYKCNVALYNVGVLSNRPPDEKKEMRQEAMENLRAIKARAPGYKDIGKVSDF